MSVLVPLSPPSSLTHALLSAAYLNLGCLLIANLIMKPRLPGRKKHVAPPSLLVIFSELRYTVAVAGAFFIALGYVPRSPFGLTVSDAFNPIACSSRTFTCNVRISLPSSNLANAVQASAS